MESECRSGSSGGGSLVVVLNRGGTVWYCVWINRWINLCLLFVFFWLSSAVVLFIHELEEILELAHPGVMDTLGKCRHCYVVHSVGPAAHFSAFSLSLSLS